MKVMVGRLFGVLSSLTEFVFLDENVWTMRVQLRELLHGKSISSNNLCLICEKAKETVDHALFHCDHAQAT